MEWSCDVLLRHVYAANLSMGILRKHHISYIAFTMELLPQLYPSRPICSDMALSAALTPLDAARHHRERTFYLRYEEAEEAMDTSGKTRALDTLGSSGQAQGSALPALESGTGETASGLLGPLNEIMGAGGDSLQGALAAWQREQDRLANRAWRRPGGMARPAGL